MLSISATGRWRQTHPGATIGLLELSGIDNTQLSLRLEEKKREVESGLRSRYHDFSRQDYLALPVMSAYTKYYKRFDKTYHVLLQVESIVHKARNLPDVSPLVDANFIAEVETLVLTAGHDVAKLEGSIVIDVSQQGDAMTQMNGTSKMFHTGDMVMKDARGICCSIIYGQDNRSPITTATTHTLYVAYAPAGVSDEEVTNQLRKIEENVRLFSPSVIVEQHNLISAPQITS